MILVEGLEHDLCLVLRQAELCGQQAQGLGLLEASGKAGLVLAEDGQGFISVGVKHKMVRVSSLWGVKHKMVRVSSLWG